MVSTVVDDRVRTVSVALALVRADQKGGPALTAYMRKALAAVPADGQPLVTLLRRYSHRSREFLVYGHALALGPAPDFVRDAGARVPAHLIAMPTLLGPEFAEAMKDFHGAPALHDFLAASEPDWTIAAAQLEAAVSRLGIESSTRQWFPGTAVSVRMIPDLTGQPGQVIATQAGDCAYFVCAPSSGNCAWDPAHIGSAILLEVIRPLVESAVDPIEATEVASLLGLSRILAQVRSDVHVQSLKQSFLLANPDYRTRLVEIVSRALVAVSLGRSLGKSVSRAYLNEQERMVGGAAVELVANSMVRYMRLVPRATLAAFLRCNVADLEAPLFARIAAN